LLLGGCYTGYDQDNSLSGGGPGDGIDDADGDDDGGDDGAPEGYEPAPVSLRLLLASQYTNTITDVLGVEAATMASPPADTALNGFTSIGAAQLALGDAAIDTYEESARAVAQLAMTDAVRIDGLVGCQPTGPTDSACFTSFVTAFGRRMFRRPLADDEVAQWVAVGTTAASDGASFDAGVQAILSGMLQSPFFLYQVEVGEPDPDNDDARRLTAYEMATRMSFFLLGTAPSPALLDAAEAGDLDNAAGIRLAAADLLTEPRATAAVQGFVSELYQINALATLPKDAEAFPTYDSELAAAMAGETAAFVDHIWRNGGDFRELFNADYTFVNDVMAAHYGIPGEFGATFVKVTLPAEQRRGGILGHASVLSLLAHVTGTSPTLRGRFVRQTLLCQNIPPPPPEVVTDLPPSEGSTMRDRLEIHMSDPSCSACHAMMDPIGFGLESYDGIGAYRTLDNGFPINDVSELDGTTFAGAAELGTLMADAPTAMPCLIRSLYRHGTGHIETADEFGEVSLVADTFADGGFQLADGLADLVASPAFRFVGSPL